MKDSKYDFIIIGTGLAGLYAADYASQFGTVALLTKSTLNISNSSWAQGGIAAVVSDDDNTELHINDTMIAGRGLCNRDAVSILVNEGRDRILELMKSGFKFDSENGELAMGMEGGHSKRRVLHAAGDATGRELINYFTKIVKNNNRISIFENTVVHKIFTSDNICFGVYAFNFNDKENRFINSSRTVLATGGASGIYSRTTNPHTATGDGLALAYDAGAKVSDLEFIQFHPTSFYSETGDTFLISEAVRGEGAYLVNSEGKRFMLDIDPLAELAPRDVVASSIFSEMKRTNSECVYLKLDHLDSAKIKTRFSHIYKEAIKYGVDITKDPVPVAPAAHYTIGGIKTGLNGETNIKGLFACGESASNGVHGANRLASNSLLECLVFAKRVIDESKNLVCENIPRDIGSINFKVDIDKKAEFINVVKTIGEIMMEKAGILRNEEEMNSAIEQIELSAAGFNYSDEEYYSDKLKGTLEICSLILKTALLRKESRGAHKRSEYPAEDPAFLFHIIKGKNEDFFTEPVN